MSNRWDFGRINPHFQYGTLHFDNDGIISNYFHFNEKYWKEYDDKIELLNENFEVTSRFKKNNNYLIGDFWDGVNWHKNVHWLKKNTDVDVVFKPDYRKINDIKNILSENILTVVKKYKRLCILDFFCPIDTKDIVGSGPMFGNIGDSIQLLGIYKLLEDNKINIPIRTIFRDSLKKYNRLENELLIINGWIIDQVEDPIIPTNDVLFVGVHGVNENLIKTFKSTKYPIGCRDFSTLGALKNINRNVYFSGCTTLLFDKYEGERNGVVCTDCPLEKDAIYQTHLICNISPADQLLVSSQLINMYKTKKSVYTSRLHCALPCIAMGTPVILKQFPDQPRTELIKYIERNV